MACILAIFKNESVGMEEWLQHHLSQGVSHIYMINNDSSDNFMPIIEKYKQYITLYTFLEPYVQPKHYNAVLPDIRAAGHKWCCVIDLDEFIVLSNPALSIPDYCEQHFVGDTDEIGIRWKLFGSSGHIQQPSSIRCGFTNCRPEPLSQKQIFLVENVNEIGIHTSTRKGGIVIVDDALVYHYNIQSWEWFESIKMTRGDADQYTNVRNHDYFVQNDADAHEVDTVLKERVESGMYSFSTSSGAEGNTENH